MAFGAQPPGPGSQPPPAGALPPGPPPGAVPEGQPGAPEGDQPNPVTDAVQTIALFAQGQEEKGNPAVKQALTQLIQAMVGGIEAPQGGAPQGQLPPIPGGPPPPQAPPRGGRLPENAGPNSQQLL